MMSKGFLKTEKKEEIEKVKRVLIGTPALDGKVHAWYTDSLINSVKLCGTNKIDLFPIMLIEESILPMARNEILNLAYQGDVDCMVFIDADQTWDPYALLKLINSPYDVIGLPVVSKTDEPGHFNVKIKNITNIERDNSGNIKVDGIGTGFLKISKKAIKSLHDSNDLVHFRGKQLKMICEYSVSNSNDFIGEDIFLCNKLKDLGFDIWVNPNFTCGHIGPKTWNGNFSEFIKYVENK